MKKQRKHYTPEEKVAASFSLKWDSADLPRHHSHAIVLAYVNEGASFFSQRTRHSDCGT